MRLVVVKRNGITEPFEKRKIVRTCLRAGLPKRIAEEIAEEVEIEVKERGGSITAHELLKLVTDLIGKRSAHHAARYNLKMALLRLGPEGFEFEKFVASLLSEIGYETRTNVVARGRCVVHEIDVLAEKDGKVYMVECKFHNFPGIYTGLKEVMYTYSRYLDLADGWRDGKGDVKPDSAWLFTNTKFSDDAKEFAACRGMLLTGWNYPRGEGIESILESKSLYPVTLLEGLDKETEEALISSGYVFCRELLNDSVEEISRRTGVSTDKLKRVVSEARKFLEFRVSEF